MKCEWKKCNLGDLGTVITGKTPATKISEYWDGNFLLLHQKICKKQNTFFAQSEQFLIKE